VKSRPSNRPPYPPSVNSSGPPPPPRPPQGGGRAVIDGVVPTWPLHRPTVFAVLADDDCIVGMGSALIRREALDQVGDFDWRAEPTDDYDFWVRLSRIGEITFVNETVLAFRQHATNRSLGPPAPRGRGTGYVRRKLITASESTPEQRRIAIEGFRAHEKTLLKKRWNALLDSRRRGRVPRSASTGPGRHEPGSRLRPRLPLALAAVRGAGGRMVGRRALTWRYDDVAPPVDPASRLT
jgi:hypothetical protein